MLYELICTSSKHNTWTKKVKTEKEGLKLFKLFKNSASKLTLKQNNLVIKKNW